MWIMAVQIRYFILLLGFSFFIFLYISNKSPVTILNVLGFLGLLLKLFSSGDWVLDSWSQISSRSYCYAIIMALFLGVIVLMLVSSFCTWFGTYFGIFKTYMVHKKVQFFFFGEFWFSSRPPHPLLDVLFLIECVCP